VSAKKLNQQIEKVEIKPYKIRSYSLDLRIHTPASDGYLTIGGIDTAPALVRLAKVKGISALGITDFYSTDYIERVLEAAIGSNILIVPGFTLRAQLDECHDLPLIALFPNTLPITQLSDLIDAFQVPKKLRGKNDFLVKVPLSEIIDQIEALEGIVIPSRIDKTPLRSAVVRRLIEKFDFTTFDLAYFDSQSLIKKQFPKRQLNLWNFSSAFSLAQVGSRTADVKLAEVSFSEIASLAQRKVEVKNTAAKDRREKSQAAVVTYSR
jgi:PHP family Zn ribbon phosphoesterase